MIQHTIAAAMQVGICYKIADAFRWEGAAGGASLPFFLFAGAAFFSLFVFLVPLCPFVVVVVVLLFCLFLSSGPKCLSHSSSLQCSCWLKYNFYLTLRILWRSALPGLRLSQLHLAQWPSKARSIYERCSIFQSLLSIKEDM